MDEKRKIVKELIETLKWEVSNMEVRGYFNEFRIFLRTLIKLKTKYGITPEELLSYLKDVK